MLHADHWTWRRAPGQYATPANLDVDKQAVMAETDEYVAFASEYKSLAGLPRINSAKVWEPRSVASFGADCIEKQMRDEHKAELHDLLKASSEVFKVDGADFRRFDSARRLYNFNIDNAGAY